MKLIQPALVMLAVSLGTVACGERNTPDDSTPDALFRGLKVVGDKAAFTESMREALRKRYSGQSPSGDLVVNESADLGTAPPSVPDTLASSAGDGQSVTGTNVQEVGVDEADRIKTDGNFLYVLNTGFQATDLPVVTDLPVDETGDTVSQTSIPFPGNQTTQVRILSLDTEAATSALITELDVDTGNESAGGMYLHKADGADSLIVTSSSFGGYWGYWGSSREFMGQQSTIHKIDVTTPASATVVDSLSLEGQIISSRRIEQYLYVASRFTPQIPQDAVNIDDTIDSLDVDDLLPVATRASDGDVQELADANNCFVTQKPANGYYSPDVITLAVVDLTTMTVSDSVCYLGASETLYASTNSIYLATTQYDYIFAISPLAESDVVSSIPESDPRVDTDIHQFDITDGTLTYAGSGQVDGHLGWNDLQKPFRMSEKDGYLRVATHSDSQRGDTSPVFVSVLKPVDGNLDVVAKIPRAGEPNIGKLREQLHATRFLGDKGYLVTFRQTDPLYVVDLSDPENPTVAGELEIEGYSDYLHPIGEDYLLGIGKGAIANTGGLDGDFRGAFAQGVKVSLFDVSDPAAPSEVQSLEIGKRGSDADALRDHHGITVQPGTDARPTRLAFGINVNEDALNGQNPGDPSAWYNWSRSGLFAFEIETGANAGISEHGSIIVESSSDNPQTFGPAKGNDRSVIAGDTVFYIHGEDVYGANWNALTTVDGPR